MMTSHELRNKYLNFFKKKGHSVIPSASLVPENDPTVLFTTAGMHPLIPYLLGENHPGGRRLTSVQKCIRTVDIDEVGDKVHHTFFEMLGNWSLGDYFKKEVIKWSYEFLTSKDGLGINLQQIAVSVFVGDEDAPFDQEAYDAWIALGIPAERIAKLPKKDNWWGPAGETGPTGPDTEMFIWTGEGEAPKMFNPEDNHWVEIWNDVFMQYNKTAEGKYEPLIQKNVDTGMGLERALAINNGFDDNYKTELFWPIIQKIEELSGKKYGEKTDEEYIKEGQQCWVDTRKQFRIIADHIKAAVFIIGDGAMPSNKDRGYIVRRLIRRAVVKGHQLGIEENFTGKLASIIFEIYHGVYFEHVAPIASSVIPAPPQVFLRSQDPRPFDFAHRASSGRSGRSEPVEDRLRVEAGILDKIPDRVGDDKEERIIDELNKEEVKFRQTLKRGINQIDTIERTIRGQISGTTGFRVSGKDLFDLYQSYGFPLELSIEEFTSRGLGIDPDEIGNYEIELKKHQELSRTASAGMFKGGLADAGEIVTRYHTATHLLNAALRKVLGDHVYQRGSNITAERMRFDFSHPEKMTPEQIKEVEELVNEQIKADLPVNLEEMTLEDAQNSGAIGVFESKYGDKVKVYTVGQAVNDYFSKEICGGPHATHTGELGRFKIVKEEASSAGVRRIKAILEQS